MPPEIFFRTQFCCPAGTSTRRGFFFVEKISFAAVSNAGAAMTSRKSFDISPAAAASTGRFTPITPPKAETGSHSRARRQASAGGLQVGDVVVGKFLALQLAGVGYTHAGAVGVHCGFLVGILAVAEIHGFLK